MTTMDISLFAAWEHAGLSCRPVALIQRPTSTLVPNTENCGMIGKHRISTLLDLPVHAARQLKAYCRSSSLRISTCLRCSGGLRGDTEGVRKCFRLRRSEQLHFGLTRQEPYATIQYSASIEGAEAHTTFERASDYVALQHWMCFTLPIAPEYGSCRGLTVGNAHTNLTCVGRNGDP